MGYSTSFDGQFAITPTLTLADFNLLKDIGRHDIRSKDFPVPSEHYPGLLCQWEPTRDGNGLKWNGGEKFYDYVEWLEWLIANVFLPRGYSLSGQVRYSGEDFNDRGTISIVNGKVTQHELLMLTAEDMLDDLPPGVYVVRGLPSGDAGERYERVSDDPDAWRQVSQALEEAASRYEDLVTELVELRKQVMR